MKQPLSFRHALQPIAFLTLLIIYGLLYRPHMRHQAVTVRDMALPQAREG